jgi:hypothetical protein
MWIFSAMVFILFDFVQSRSKLVAKVLNKGGQRLWIPQSENEINKSVSLFPKVDDSQNAFQMIVFYFFQIIDLCIPFAMFVEHRKQTFADTELQQRQTCLILAIQHCLSLNHHLSVFCFPLLFYFSLVLHLYAFVYVFIAYDFLQLLERNIVIVSLFVGRRNRFIFLGFWWRLQINCDFFDCVVHSFTSALSNVGYYHLTKYFIRGYTIWLPSDHSESFPSCVGFLTNCAI